MRDPLASTASCTYLVLPGMRGRIEAHGAGGNMAAPHQIEVDLSDPARLERVERDYLRLSVCPVADRPSPGLLVPVTVILKLPGDVQVASAGKVIQVTGPLSFLVQLDSPPDLERLKRIAAEPSRAPRAPMPRRSTGSIPVPPRVDARPKAAREAPGARPGGPAAAEIDLDFLDQMAEAPPAPRPATGPTHGRRHTDPGTAPGRAAHAAPHAAPHAAAPAAAPAVPTIALVDTLDPDLDMRLVGRLPTGGSATAATAAATAAAPEAPGDDAPLPDLEDPPVSSLEHWTPDLDALLEPGAVEPAAGAPRPPAPAVTGNESDTSDVYARIKNLTLPEKQRLARHGRRPVRNLLIRDPNKNLHRLVVANPDVGMDEITEYSAYPGLSKEAIEFIAQNRTWVAMRQVAFNLVRNPATPVDVAVRLVPRLGPNEWRWLARPGAVRMPIAAAARKQIVEGAS